MLKRSNSVFRITLCWCSKLGFKVALFFEMCFQQGDSEQRMVKTAEQA